MMKQTIFCTVPGIFGEKNINKKGKGIYSILFK
jgi:hypothetical protein